MGFTQQEVGLPAGTGTGPGLVQQPYLPAVTGVNFQHVPEQEARQAGSVV